MYFQQIFDRSLAQYAYIIGCQATGEAIVIDPMRDIDQYFALVERECLRIVATAETHIHADYLSGCRELAERGGITVYLSDCGGPDWSYQWEGDYPHKMVKHGDTFMIGNIKFEVLHTPGHTPEHICFVVTDTPATESQPMGILTGDFVFCGDVGRPDLLETAGGQVAAMEPSARTLYESIQKFREMPPAMQLWPGHGAGSACGKALGAVPMSTIGYELSVNASILAATSSDAFVEFILDGQPEPPLYFGRMKVQNKTGPAVLGKFPDPRIVRQEKLPELSGATGVAVLDTRSWEDYRAAHLPGSLFTPMNKAFNTVVGSYVPDGMPIYLIVEESRLHDAVVDLVHVGLDHVVGYATPDMFLEYRGSGKTASITEIAAEDIEENLGDALLLDVRRASEIARHGAIAGSTHIAHTRLLDRLEDVPKDRPIVVHCQTGVRSAYASGLLDRHGYKVTNAAGGFEAWKARSNAGADTKSA